jgi:hypothetical protein
MSERAKLTSQLRGKEGKAKSAASQQEAPPVMLSLLVGRVGPAKT